MIALLKKDAPPQPQAPAEPKPEKPKEKKKGLFSRDKKGDKKKHDHTSSGLSEGRSKRLSTIKGAISKPLNVTKAPAAAKPEPTEDLEKDLEGLEVTRKPEPKEEQKDVDIKELVPKKAPGGQTDEDKMDQEVARKLTEGMDSLQKEIAEMKQLLETLRELNVKLIEVMEKK
jgi:hypothetical protein